MITVRGQTYRYLDEGEVILASDMMLPEHQDELSAEIFPVPTDLVGSRYDCSLEPVVRKEL